MSEYQWLVLFFDILCIFCVIYFIIIYIERNKLIDETNKQIGLLTNELIKLGERNNGKTN
jgi:hypothetical protein